MTRVSMAFRGVNCQNAFATIIKRDYSKRADFAPKLSKFFPVRFWLCWGLTTRQPLRVILCRLPEKGRKEIEERVEEMKERDREERGTGMKVKKQKK